MSVKKYIPTALLLAVFNLSISNTSAQTLPEKAMGKPKVLTQETESWRWYDIADKQQWGEETQQRWIVWIDRSGVKSHTEPSSSSPVKENSLQFMHEYQVAKSQNRFLLLFEIQGNNETDLTIPKRAKCIGWVSVDNLLLWSICPRTHGQIYEKAVILRDFDEIDKADIATISPDFYKNPTSKEPTGFVASDLEFFFVYKRDRGNVLLFTDKEITKNNIVGLKFQKIGWIKKGFYTSWNTRTCYEPNFDERMKGLPAAVFREQSNAMSYKANGDTSHAIYKEKLSGERWSPNWVRFPVVSNSIGIVQVGTIGKLGDAYNASAKKGDMDDLNKKIDEIKQKLGRINIVFVVDGTHSMTDYYKPMATAIKNAMNRNGMTGDDMYFGAVIYRNYADADLIESIPLDKDYSKVSNWIAARDCHSIGTTHYEAMFYGIDYALKNMKWNRSNANFIILIGDAANAPNDKRAPNMDALASNMSSLGINFVAFQVNNRNRKEYTEFAPQVGELLIKELSHLVSSVKKKDFEFRNRVYQYKSNSWPIYSSAFRYAKVGQSENPDELKNLVEDRIISFKNQTREELSKLEKSLSTGQLTPEMEKELRKSGVTDKQIALLKEHRSILKVNGYTSMIANGKKVFSPCVFMSKTELDELIRSLQRVSSSSTDNPRLELQNALKSLAMTYIGQGKKTDEMSIDDVMSAISGLTTVTGKDVLSRINLKDITDPTRFSDSEIKDFIRSISDEIIRLEKIRNNKECYFDKNKIRYFYILIDDMPLQDHSDSPY